jgi:acyl carrier protein
MEMQDSSERATIPLAGTSSRQTGHQASGASAEQIESWLVSYLANLLAIPESEVSRTLTFEQFGLDSAAAVALTGDLARWLETDLDPTLASKHKTVADLSGHISVNVRSPFDGNPGAV